MHSTGIKNERYTGVGLALLAVIIWSGNFIAARDMKGQVPPISLAFYRWLTASIIMFPFAIRTFKREWKAVTQSGGYLFMVALCGVALFNTFVYIGGQYTTAINLAIIGTTSSPIMSILLARIFLKEKIGWQKLMGLLLCISGVLFLLSKGSFQNLLTLRFSSGDLWVLAAAFFFAVYNVSVKKRPSSVSPLTFLFVIFSVGTFLLLPFYLWEMGHTAAIQWSLKIFLVILYLGLGASVICFIIWNIAIHKIGAGRTALFGNLIPVFSSIEAVFYLGEKFTIYHVISMIAVFAGLLLANWRSWK